MRCLDVLPGHPQGLFKVPEAIGGSVKRLKCLGSPIRVGQGPMLTRMSKKS